MILLDEIEKAPPESLNRVDEMVVFHALTRSQLREIVDLQAESLKQMLAERELALPLTAAARDAVAGEGYDPQFGARPLKRTLQRRVQNPLAMRLLQGEFKPGGGVVVDFRDRTFTFGSAPGIVAALEATEGDPSPDASPGRSSAAGGAHRRGG